MKHTRGQRFTKRIYPPRVIAFGLAFLCIAAVLHENNSSRLVWILAFVNGILWPHLAYFLANKAPNSYRAEKLNFLCDAFWAGLWLPIIQFNLLPSYAVVSMICMSLMAVGGAGFFLNGVSMILIGLAVSSLFVGISFNIDSSSAVIYFTLPYIIIFPIVVSMITYTLAIQLSQQRKQLEKLRREDELSGLYNRVFWEEQVANEFRRFQRMGNRSSVILLDVDNFKQINDTYGHRVGDQVIEHIGKVIMGSLREIDIAGRYGGEEFGVVLPDADSAAAMQIAERLRRNIEQKPVPGQDISITVSVGVVELAEHLQNYSQWLERADGALYRAKMKGRNCTELANILVPEYS